MDKLDERTENRTRPAVGIDLAVVSEPASAVAESYRALRSTVKFANIDPPPRVIAIADSGSNGQQAAAAANLAAALALGGDAVILVDSDLRQPRLHEIFRLSNDQGLAEWLAASDGSQSIPLVETGIPGLLLLPAGHAPKLSGVLPADLLSSDLCTQLFAALRQDATFVIVTMPSLADYGDGLAIAPRADGVLLLVRSGKTKRAAAQRAKESLDRVGARVLGAVLTDSGHGLRR